MKMTHEEWRARMQRLLDREAREALQRERGSETTELQRLARRTAEAQEAAEKVRREYMAELLGRARQDSIAEIARELGVTRQRVSFLVNRERR